MANKELPDIDDIRNRVIYDPQTGCFTFRERPVTDFRPIGNNTAEARRTQWNSRWGGKPAFATENAMGYLVGHFRNKLLAAHRVAFALMEGRWPLMVDHINGDRTDNRWSNLRETTPTGNLMNCKVRSDNSTGRTGVKPDRRKGSGYIANIKVAGRLIHLGTFSTIEEAAASRQTAEKLLGFSKRHGKPL